MTQLSLDESQIRAATRHPANREAAATAKRANDVERGPNVDPREVAYYRDLAATWWDATGPFWPLHRLNELRTRYLRDQLTSLFSRDPRSDTPLKGLSILDVGCGGGILSESMARLGGVVHGIDVVEKNIEVARTHAASSGLPLRYDATSTSALIQAGVRYDVVLNMEVVEHVPDVATFMTECAGLVEHDGVMAVSTINRTPLSWLFAIVGAEYVLGWLPRGTHRWSQFQKPEEIESYLSGDGFDVVARSGVRVNPLNRHFALTRWLSVNYMLLAKRGFDNRGADVR